MKIDTKRLIRALTEYRKRKLELAGTDSDENYYVESEVREMQNTIREGESLTSKFTSNGLYDKRGE
jgi:type II secretory pathway component PulF